MARIIALMAFPFWLASQVSALAQDNPAEAPPPPAADECAIFDAASAAMEQDQPHAYFEVGRHYRQGKCVEQDDVKAREYYEKSAAFSFPAALSQLGEMLCDGLGGEADCERGMQLLLAADKLGLIEANRMLAYNYVAGRGTEQDYTKAVEAYRKSIEIMNDPHAAYELAKLYADGDGPDHDYGYALYAAEFARSNEIENTDLLIEQLTEQRDIHIAEREAAVENDPGADHYFKLSEAYKTLATDDGAAKSLEALEMSANLGHFDGRKALAASLYNESTDPADHKRARALLERAMAQDEAGNDAGDVEFQYANFLMNFYDGEDKNTRIINALEISAEQGSGDANYMLSEFHLSDVYIPADLVRAEALAERAVELGHPGAGRLLFTIRSIREASKPDSDAEVITIVEEVEIELEKPSAPVENGKPDEQEPLSVEEIDALK